MTDKLCLAGVMGDPVAHSRSPWMHNHWLRRYSLPGGYVALPVLAQNLEPALRGLPFLGFRGVNLTLPHKENALRLMDEVSPAARTIGAVNCVSVLENGGLRGDNFDCDGFIAALREGAPNWRADAAPTLILGAGGAARAILFGLMEAGARELRLANRSLARAQNLADEFNSSSFTALKGGKIHVVHWSERAQALRQCGLLVNTTQLGMAGQEPLEMDLRFLEPEAVVNDIVYAPLETQLLADARARQNIGVNGLGMLIHQARPAFSRWFGVMPDNSLELRALMERSLVV